MAEPSVAPVLLGRSIVCRPFTAADITPRYLEWLNDPEVNRYSRRRYVQTTEADARRFLESLRADEHVLAICTRDGDLHVGNIQFGPIEWTARWAEIRILIGEKSRWGRGYATEALYLVTRHLFLDLGLHRVEANTCNPAFARAVEKLGWQLEGRLRERFLDGDVLLDYLCFGMLRPAFERRPDLEC